MLIDHFCFQFLILPLQTFFPFFYWIVDLFSCWFIAALSASLLTFWTGWFFPVGDCSGTGGSWAAAAPLSPAWMPAANPPPPAVVTACLSPGVGKAPSVESYWFTETLYFSCILFYCQWHRLHMSSQRYCQIVNKSDSSLFQKLFFQERKNNLSCPMC